MSEGGRVLPQKTKLPIWRTVGDAYSFVFDYLRDFVALAAIPFMISVVGYTSILFIQFLPEDVVTQISETVRLGAWVVVALYFFILFLTVFVPWLVSLVAWHRFVLLGKRDTHRPVQFHLGRRELKFFGYGLILGFFVISIDVIGLLLASQGLGLPTISFKFGLSINSADVLLVLLSVRFLFLFPAIAVGDDTGIAAAWKQSGGVAWRLFWVLFFAALPFGLLFAITEPFGTEEMEMIDTANQGSLTVGDLWLIIIQGLVVFLGSAVSVAALALSYEHTVSYEHAVGESGGGGSASY